MKFIFESTTSDRYLELAEKYVNQTINDTEQEELAKLVEDAANKNGYTILAYHGTKNPGFTKFKPSKQATSQFGEYKFGDAEVSYFTADKEVAEGYTEIGIEENGNIYYCFLRMNNPYVVDNSTKADIKSWLNIQDSGLRKKQIAAFKKVYDHYNYEADYEPGYIEVPEWTEINEYFRTFGMILEVTEKGTWEVYSAPRNSMYGSKQFITGAPTLEDLFIDDYCKEDLFDFVVGEDENDYYYDIDTIINIVLYLNKYEGETYDGIVVGDIRDTGPLGGLFTNPTTDYVIFSPEQVKSADKVVFDSNGNIQPLEKRFRKTSDDIYERYRR